MGRLLQQAAHFGTDLVGLERFLRLIQSVAHIFCSSPALLALAMSLVAPQQQQQHEQHEPKDGSSSPSLEAAAGLASVAAQALLLRNQINLVRRTLRLFRFLDSFRLAGAQLAQPPGLLATVDATSLSLLGMYGLLETATLPDAYGVGVLGAGRAAAFNVEAARCWFAALACAVVAGGLRLFAAPARAGRVPAKTSHARLSEKRQDRADAQSGVPTAQEDHDGSENATVDAPTPAPPAAAKFDIASKMVADGLDMLLPASNLGWAPGLEQWQVGSAMLLTTVLTGWHVWQRCGRDVQMRAS